MEVILGGIFIFKKKFSMNYNFVFLQVINNLFDSIASQDQTLKDYIGKCAGELMIIAQ